MKTQKTSFYKNIYNLDDPCKPDIKKVANELRRTHFKLGNNPSNNLSQYKHDYPEYDQFPDLAQDPNLRKSHTRLQRYLTPDFSYRKRRGVRYG